MLTTGNAMADSLLQSGAKQIPSLFFTFADNATLAVNANRIMQNGIKILRSAFSGNTLEVGSVVAADLEITLYNSDGFFDNYALEGANCEATVSVDYDGTLYPVKLGYFTIDTVEEIGGTIRLKGLDCMADLDVPYVTGEIPDGLFPTTLPVLLLAVNAALVVKSIYVVFDFLSGASVPDIIISGMPTNADMTYRDILSWLVQLCGFSAYADTENNGYIKLAKLVSPIAGQLYVSHRIKATLAKNKVYVDEIVLNGDRYFVADATTWGDLKTDQRTWKQLEEYKWGKIPPANIKYSINLGSNPFYDLVISSEAIDKETVLYWIWAYMRVMYNPLTATTLPCPLYIPFDTMQYYTNDAKYTTTLISDVQWTLNSNTYLESKGISEQNKKYATQSPVTARQADYIQQQIEQSLQSR